MSQKGTLDGLSFFTYFSFEKAKNETLNKNGVVKAYHATDCACFVFTSDYLLRLVIGSSMVLQNIVSD